MSNNEITLQVVEVTGRFPLAAENNNAAAEN